MRNLPAQTTEYGPGGSQSVLEQLLARIASGDREALGQLYHRNRSAVYALTLSYTKNAQDAEDLMQDTFVRVWDSAGQYRGRGSAMGWLLAIARNLALMKLREREQQGSLDEDEWNALPAHSSSLTPEDRLLAQNALSTLDDQERRCGRSEAPGDCRSAGPAPCHRALKIPPHPEKTTDPNRRR